MRELRKGAERRADERRVFEERRMEAVAVPVERRTGRERRLDLDRRTGLDRRSLPDRRGIGKLAAL